MYTKMHNALVNHFLAVFFSIFQVFLVLLTHVVYRNFYYNKPWHEGNGGILVGAVHSKPHVLGSNPVLAAIFHIFMNPSPSNFLWPNGFAQIWLCCQK